MNNGKNVIFVLCVFIAAGLGIGCDAKSDNKAQEIKVGSETLQQMLKNGQAAAATQPVIAYLHDRYSQTLRDIKNRKSVADAPILISAAVYKDLRNGASTWSIRIEWFESGFAVHGVGIRTRGGKILAFPNAFQWDHDDRNWFAGTAWRDTWIPVVSNSGAPWLGAPSRWKAIIIPEDVIESPLEAYLIFDGGSSNAVPVFVQKSSAEG